MVSVHVVIIIYYYVFGLLIIFLCFSFDPSTLGLSCVNVVLLAEEVHQNMAEVHQKYDFIDPRDPMWDRSPFIAKSDLPKHQYFAEYANQLRDTEVLFLFPILIF